MKRIVVGAHYGLIDWLAQRITALIIAVYCIGISGALLAGGGGHAAWRELMACAPVRFASFLFILALCWHAWVGVRDIWMDYVKNTAARLTLHVLTLLVLLGDAGWATQIIWRL